MKHGIKVKPLVEVSVEVRCAKCGEELTINEAFGTVNNLVEVKVLPHDCRKEG